VVKKTKMTRVLVVKVSVTKTRRMNKWRTITFMETMKKTLKMIMRIVRLMTVS
jgi:hypothetical protein